MPNYSIIQLNEVELYNGIRILIKDFVIKSDETGEPIVQISTLQDISPNFLRDLRVQKGLTDVAGKLNPKHPHFNNKLEQGVGSPWLHLPKSNSLEDLSVTFVNDFTKETEC